MAVVFVLLSVFVTAGMGYQCGPSGTENVEIGCRTYYKCSDGVGIVVVCNDVGTGFVYNSATGQCDDPINVAPPCGQQKDCSTKADGRYADKDNGCHSYYTCNSGTFFGHSLCAGTLVFDEAKQTCNWPNNVLPPCGTSNGTTPY